MFTFDSSLPLPEKDMEHMAFVPGEEQPPASWEPFGSDPLPKELNLFSLFSKAQAISPHLLAYTNIVLACMLTHDRPQPPPPYSS